MGFSKAAQVIQSVERDEWITALIAYKAECRMLATARKLYKNSLIRSEHLKWLEAKERHSIASKLLHAAKQQYANAQAVQKLKAKGIDVTALKLAQLAGIQIPMSLKEMLEETRKERLIASTPSGELEELIRVNREIMEGKQNPLTVQHKKLEQQTVEFGGITLSTEDKPVFTEQPSTQVDKAEEYAPIEFDEFDKL